MVNLISGIFSINKGISSEKTIPDINSDIPNAVCSLYFLEAILKKLLIVREMK